MDYLRYYLGAGIVCAGIAGFSLGGYWVWSGFATYLILLLIDLVLKPDLRPRQINMPWLADIPLYLHLFLMVALYGAFFHWASFVTENGSIPVINIIGAVLSLGWLGAVPNLPINHELMHRRNPLARTFATILGTFYMDPTRDVAHVHTHHIHLGTPKDSDTARRGETIYTFAFRATIGSFKDFIEIEKSLCEKKNQSFFSPIGRFFRAILQVSLLIGLAGWFGGAIAILISILAIFTAKMFVEAFNYFQHYGLVRVEGTPYDSQHIWNHLTPINRMIAFEITNHNDHHMDAFAPYYTLQPHPAGPQMPSILLCFLAGLVPPIWFKYIAKPRLKNWDFEHATNGEKKLAQEANRKAGWPDWISE